MMHDEGLELVHGSQRFLVQMRGDRVIYTRTWTNKGGWLMARCVHGSQQLLVRVRGDRVIYTRTSSAKHPVVL